MYVDTKTFPAEVGVFPPDEPFELPYEVSETEVFDAGTIIDAIQFSAVKMPLPLVLFRQLVRIHFNTSIISFRVINVL